MKYNTNLKGAFIYFVLLTYLKPVNVTLIEPLDMTYKLLKVVATLLILVLLIKKKFRFSKTSWCCVVLMAVWMVSIYLNTGSLTMRAQEILSIFGMLVFCNYYVDVPEGIQQVIKALANISKVYIVLNFITVLLDRPLFAEPSESYIKYFLGYDNYTAFIIIPLTGFIFANDYVLYQRIKINSWIVLLLGLLSFVIPFAVTAIASYGLFLLAVAIMDAPQIKRIFTTRNICVCSSVFVLVVLSPKVRAILESTSIVGKRGLNSREVIWPMAVEAFKSNPLLGFGEFTEEQVSSYILYGMNHAHNIFLEFLIKVGIVGAVVAAVWTYFLFKKITRVKDKAMYSLLICVAAYVLCSLLDFYFALIYFWLLIIIVDSYKESMLRGQRTLYIKQINK